MPCLLQSERFAIAMMVKGNPRFDYCYKEAKRCLATARRLRDRGCIVLAHAYAQKSKKFMDECAEIAFPSV
jgi:hypothetical protein